MLRISSTNTALRKLAWDTKLHRDIQTYDIFTSLEGTYTEKKKNIPEAAVMKVQAPEGVRQTTLALLKDLSGSPIEGRDQIIGNEQDQVLRQLTLYGHEVKCAVNTEQYGIDAIDKSAYNLLAAVNPQMAKQQAEFKGKYMREALCQNYGSMLLKTPVSATQGINSNIFVAGVALASQPAYSTTLSTYKQYIDTATPTTPLAVNQASISVLNDLQNWATVTKTIEPLDIGGKNMYILTIPSNQAQVFRTPATTNSLAALYRDADVRGPENLAIKGYLGTYGCFILVEDPRAPNVLIASNAVTFGYVGAGGSTTKTANAVTTWDVGFLLGKGGLSLYNVKDAFYKEEIQDYESIKGVASIAIYGTQATQFDTDTITATTIHNKSSALVLFGSSLT
jgi:hypothetical protein